MGQGIVRTSNWCLIELASGNISFYHLKCIRLLQSIFVFVPSRMVHTQKWSQVALKCLSSLFPACCGDDDAMQKWSVEALKCLSSLLASCHGVGPMWRQNGKELNASPVHFHITMNQADCNQHIHKPGRFVEVCDVSQTVSLHKMPFSQFMLIPTLHSLLNILPSVSFFVPFLGMPTTRLCQNPPPQIQTKKISQMII